MKMLVTFEKAFRLRMIGHLDLMRAMQRALRRSDLPIRYSQGFNPHILLTFAAPLSLGHTGLREVMEVPVEGECNPDFFKARLQRALPPEIQLVSVRAVDDTHKSPMALLYAARYRADLEEVPDALRTALPAFLAQGEITAVKKTKTGEKTVDLKPMIHECSLNGNAVYLTLDLREESSCKPELLLRTLSDFAGVPLPRFTCTRLMLFAMRDLALIPLEDA